ncbi:hypothetical protein BZG35_02385 [Brevundimonas sp. LM2]|nr:hypothetical protein BZG35_02385 [Brevundimonas sp. LM2]
MTLALRKSGGISGQTFAPTDFGKYEDHVSLNLGLEEDPPLMLTDWAPIVVAASAKAPGQKGSQWGRPPIAFLRLPATLKVNGAQ